MNQEKWRRTERAHASYPGISCRPPGSALIWSGKKGEIRDCTIYLLSIIPGPAACEAYEGRDLFF